MSPAGDALIAAITDSGTWDTDSARSRRDDRGRGLAMMEQLMDDVAIECTQLGTCVTLRRRCTGGGA